MDKAVKAVFGWTIEGEQKWVVEMKSDSTDMETVRRLQAAFLAGFAQAGIITKQ